MHSQEKFWFVKTKAEVLGPYSLREMLQMLDSGKIGSSDFVRQEGQSAFSPAGTFEIFRLQLEKQEKVYFEDEVEAAMFADRSGIRSMPTGLGAKETSSSGRPPAEPARQRLTVGVVIFLLFAVSILAGAAAYLLHQEQAGPAGAAPSSDSTENP